MMQTGLSGRCWWTRNFDLRRTLLTVKAVAVDAPQPDLWMRWTAKAGYVVCGLYDTPGASKRDHFIALCRTTDMGRAQWRQICKPEINPLRLKRATLKKNFKVLVSEHVEPGGA
jgi:hypothetical protein